MNLLLQILLYRQELCLWHLQEPTVAGENTLTYKIRVHIFEGVRGRVFKEGGVAVRDSVFEPTALDETRKFGVTSSVTNDNYIAHIGIYSKPLGETFGANQINAVAEALVEYYDGVSSDVVWSPITV